MYITINNVISIYILVSYITIITNCLEKILPSTQAAKREKKWGVICPNCHASLFSLPITILN